jgi:cell division septation protein DedD
MNKATFAKVLIAASAAILVAGCQQGAGTGSAPAPAGETVDAGTGISTGENLSLVARDVEAPELFSVTDAGLWDGRPSLGGVWVAHSEVTEPQRVIIRNSKNGKSVIGALFRREAANPGPSLQMSSDAAAALEILAGAPTEISVVALRREEPAAPAAAAAAPAADPEATDAAGGTADIAATAAAALDEAEGIAPAAEAAAVPLADDGTVADPAAAPEAPKKRKGLFGGIFGTRRNAAPDAPLDATAGAAADATAGAAPAPGAPIAAGTIGAAPAASAPVSAAPIAATLPAGGIDRAYVQIGIFSVEANAQRAADQMKAAGMTATVKTDASNGKTFWRVIVGPAASVAERDALAARVKGIGYPDAYPVKG